MKKQIQILVAAAIIGLFSNVAWASGTLTGTLSCLDPKGMQCLFPSVTYVEIYNAVNAEYVTDTRLDQSGNFSVLLVPGVYKVRMYQLIFLNGNESFFVKEYAGPENGVDSFDLAEIFTVKENQVTSFTDEMTARSYDASPMFRPVFLLHLELRTLDQNGAPISGVEIRVHDAESGVESTWFECQVTTDGTCLSPYVTDDAGNFTGRVLIFGSSDGAEKSLGKLRLVDRKGRYLPQYAGYGSDQFTPAPSFTFSGRVDQPSTAALKEFMKTLPPQDQAAALVAQIAEVVSSASDGQSLTAPVQQAIKLLTDDNPNNDKATCAFVTSFRSQLKGKLASNNLSPEAAGILQAQADQLAVSLNCQK